MPILSLMDFCVINGHISILWVEALKNRLESIKSVVMDRFRTLLVLSCKAVFWFFIHFNWLISYVDSKIEGIFM